MLLGTILGLVLGSKFSWVGLLSLFARINKRNQLLRAPSSVGKRDSMRVDEGRKGRRLLAIRMKGTYRSGEGGGEPPW